MIKKICSGIFLLALITTYTACKKAHIEPAKSASQQHTGVNNQEKPVEHKYRAPLTMKGETYVCHNQNAAPCIDVWRIGGEDAQLQVGDKALFTSYKDNLPVTEAGILTVLETDSETGSTSVAYEKILE